MKKFVPLVFAFVLSLCVVSCDNDDDDPAAAPVVAVSESDLLGDWELANMVCSDGKIVTEISALPVPITNDFSGQGTAYDYTATFTNEPNGVLGKGNYTVDVVISPPVGGAVTETIDLISIPFLDLATWTLDGNTLTTDSLIGSKSVTIIAISATELKLQGELSSIIPLEVLEGLDFDGATIKEISGTATITFTK